MLEQYSTDQLSAAFAGIGLIVVIVGTYIAVGNLRIIAKTSQLEAFDAFEQRWNEMKEHRQRVLEGFHYNPSRPPSLDSEMGQVIRQVVNNLNVVGSMVENKLLPSHLVLGLCYPDFIRYEYHLRDYLKFRSDQLGIQYGARVGRLAKRAKRYHDLRHPNECIKTMTRDGHYKIIYEPPVVAGLASRKRKIEASYRRVTSQY